jgi:hypothetical protein
LARTRRRSNDAENKHPHYELSSTNNKNNPGMKDFVSVGVIKRKKLFVLLYINGLLEQDQRAKQHCGAYGFFDDTEYCTEEHDGKI